MALVTLVTDSMECGKKGARGETLQMRWRCQFAKTHNNKLLFGWFTGKLSKERLFYKSNCCLQEIKPVAQFKKTFILN